MTRWLKYILCLICERYHRYVFDVHYKQDAKRGWFARLNFRILDGVLYLTPDYPIEHPERIELP